MLREEGIIHACPPYNLGGVPDSMWNAFIACAIIVSEPSKQARDLMEVLRSESITRKMSET
jgi:hypothetical protein